MEPASVVIAIVVGVVVGSAISRWIGLPAPILLVAGGFVVSLLPEVPRVELEPDLVLVVLLPPLLYAAAIRSSLVDVRRLLGPIVQLAVGLVLVTVLAVGAALHAVVPAVTLAAAMALGAVVAPPDAVAASAVARRVGLGRRMVAVLEGESLFNDATALVALSVAVAAATGNSLGTPVVVEFLLVALGGLAIGVVVGVLLSLLRRQIRDTLTDVAMSLVAPFAAFAPAEHLGVSGVLAVVTTGLILADRAPRDQHPEARLVETAVWTTIQFLLEGAVFVLIGLQLRWLVTEVTASRWDLVVGSLVVLGVVVLVRPAYIFLVSGVARLLGRRRAERVTAGHLVVVSWAGMRGVVSLAAGLSLPAAIAHRDLLLFYTVVVILGTLVVQGLTLPFVIRKMGVGPADPSADAKQRARAQVLAGEAARQRLEELVREEQPPAEVVERLRRNIDARELEAEEEAGLATGTSNAATYARLRRELIVTERNVLVSLRDAGELDDEVLREVQRELDLEHAILQPLEEEPGGMLEELIPIDHDEDETDAHAAVPKGRTS